MRLQHFILISMFCPWVQLHAEFYRGDMNGFTTDNFMTQDTSFGSIWKVTLTSSTSRSTSAFLFDQDGDYVPKWAQGSNATKNGTIGSLTEGGAVDLQFNDEVSGRRYTFNMNAGHTAYVVMETDNDPVTLSSVFDNHDQDPATSSVPVIIQTSASLSTQESVWVRFATTNTFATSVLVPATGSGTNYTALIPSQTAGTPIYYYALSSTMPSNQIISNFDLCTLRGKNAGTSNFYFRFGTANCWHIPTNTEPPGVTMRNPTSEPTTNQAVYIYNGNQFQGEGNAGDQNGGTLYYRKIGDVSWNATSLVFNSESGEVENNKYWRGVIPANTYGITNRIEYYLEITYNDHNTTYLGTTDQLYSVTYATETSAQANAFAYTYSSAEGSSAAYMWHNDNRVTSGTNVQCWVKIGYAEGTGTNRYVDYAAIYYTTNGSTPGGAFGTATNADTSVQLMSFDHMEEDSYEGGDAMWWVGALTNLPMFTTINYKIGSWKTTNSVERFADYNTSGTNNAIFSFSLGTSGSQTLTVNNVSADYTTTKFFIDEIAGDTETITALYSPGVANVTNAEIFSNLDRRDYSDVDYTNAFIAADGYPDGVKPPDANYLTINDTGSYFRCYTMTSQGDGSYAWTGTVSKTGAYRLTARFQTNGSPTWTWYTDSSAGRRDHAIVVTPKKALEMTLYELNTLTVEATSPDETGRSTFVDLLNASEGDSDGFDPFNLEYLNTIQANCLWFQPIHPNGYERSENDPDTGVPYAPGSPYATKDYFAVTPTMGSDGTDATALSEFTNFVAKCDSYTGSVGTINIMLDGVFNHTSWDAQMGTGGVALGFASAATNRIGHVRPQWNALITDYGEEATNYISAYDNDFATAPDRGDFGKWSDVTELYFGKYSALVRHNPDNNGDYLNEDDVYDFSGMTTNQIDLWKYFAYYVDFWLEKTGHAGTNSYDLEQDNRGIDALRCDFGQGLPPQCWEYIINHTRRSKWNFVFMAETLDGGIPGYRSNRHFDLLNENLVFQFTQSHITNSEDLVSALESRRTTYSGGAILLNTTSHDEVLPDDDPWVTASRFAALSSVDGLPMIFYGEEQGIKNYNATDPTYDGFAHHELNFGKYIPHFKKYNQLTVWTNPPPDSTGMAQWHGYVNRARLNSPALESRNRYFLELTGGGKDSRIFAVAKYESNDVVLAFSRFLEHGASHTAAANTYDLQAPWSVLGLNTGKLYTVRNLASSDPSFHFTNGWPRTGQDLYDNGIYVSLGAGASTSITNDGEIVQYLKMVEINQAPSINLPGPHSLPVGATTNFAVTATDTDQDSVTLTNIVAPSGATFLAGIFSWTATPAFAGTTNAVIFVTNDQRGETNSIVTNSTTIVVPYDSDNDQLGDAWEFTHFGTLTNEANGDADGDGANNFNEFIASTAPTNSASLFVIEEMTPSGQTNRLIQAATEPGKKYIIYYADSSFTDSLLWTNFANTNLGFGAWIETNAFSTNYVFRDDETTNTTLAPPSNGHRFYRIHAGNP